jgi:hypothetical protein
MAYAKGASLYEVYIMTFIGSVAELERRRASGQSPQGGAAPDFSELVLPSELEPTVKANEVRTQILNQLLEKQWNHPLDTKVMAAIARLTGVDSRSTILLAADYVWRDNRKELPTGHSKTAYQELLVKVIVDEQLAVS